MAIEFKIATDADNRIYINSHACPKCKEYGLCPATCMANECMICGKCEALFDRDLNRLVDDDFRCKKCGLKSVNRHDPCIMNLPGVKYACCGHGVEDAYIALDSGHIIRGKFDHLED